MSTGPTNPVQYAHSKKPVSWQLQAMTIIIDFPDGASRSLPAELTGTGDDWQVLPPRAAEHPVEPSASAVPLAPATEPER